MELFSYICIDVYIRPEIGVVLVCSWKWVLWIYIGGWGYWLLPITETRGHR